MSSLRVQQNGRISKHRALLIGCHGGVGRAVLSLLKRSDPGRKLLQKLETLVLVDREPGTADVPANAVLLPPVRITSAAELVQLVREHRITQVVDVSSIDTLECASACDELGADFLCTSVEEWPAQSSRPTDEAISGFLPARRPELPNASHLIGAGANPGIVNALLFAAMEEFAARVEVDATPADLQLHAALVTEEDTTVEASNPDPGGVFPMTWSPRHCLDELFERRAFIMRRGHLVNLRHGPTEKRYRARCGDTVIEGMAVPHEEVITLGTRFPELETAFVYRLAPAARMALARKTQRNTSTWRTRKLYPPNVSDLQGEDRLGILLCSRRYGELWMGYRTDVRAGLKLSSNATLLQVAAGVLAGWHQLGTRKGLHFVEDLDWRAFLRTTHQVLGTPLVVHDPSVAARTFEERAVSGDDSRTSARRRPAARDVTTSEPRDS